MIKLAYFTKADFKQLIDWLNTEELLLNWSGRLFSFPLTDSSLNWYISDTNNLSTSEAFVYKAIDEYGNIVGHISLGGISTTNNSGRISRVFVSPTARGQSICTQMVLAVLQIGFEQLKLHRISLGVYSTNAAAVKCYQKAGLSIEGVNRDVLLHNNSYWSNIEMSILDYEWFEKKVS